MPIADDFFNPKAPARLQERGPELAAWLARHLSDLEFELLVRKRVESVFLQAEADHPNLDRSHHQCSYRHRFEEDSEWITCVGENYRNTADQRGQVLSVTVEQSVRIMQMRDGNKISKLLGAPTDTE